MGKETFNPEERHYQLDLSDDGTDVTCTRCKKLLEHLPGGAGEMDMILGQYRYIRQKLPCATPPERTE